MGGDAVARLGDLLGSVLGPFLDQPVVRLALGAAGAYVVVVWLACAWWAFADARRRTLDPAVPYAAAGLVILASPLLFPLALLVYGVLRPGRTMAEARLLDLEQEVEAINAAGVTTCPGCGRLADEAWLSCPVCRTRLAYACRGCGRPVGLDWSLCAWCGTEFGGSRLPLPTPVPAFAAPAGPLAASQPVEARFIRDRRRGRRQARERALEPTRRRSASPDARDRATGTFVR